MGVDTDTDLATHLMATAEAEGEVFAVEGAEDVVAWAYRIRQRRKNSARRSGRNPVGQAAKSRPMAFITLCSPTTLPMRMR